MRLSLKRGQKAELARRTGFSRSYITSIINGTKRASPETATKLVEAAKSLDIDLCRLDLIYPEERHQ